MKKAFLVTFFPMTRVIVDIPDGKDENDKEIRETIVKAAAQRIISMATDKLNDENCESVEEDIECPYDPKDPQDEPSTRLRIKGMIKRLGKNGVLDLTDEEDEVNWDFNFDDFWLTLTLVQIKIEGEDVVLVWENKTENCKFEETLDEIDEDRFEEVYGTVLRDKIESEK